MSRPWSWDAERCYTARGHAGHRFHAEPRIDQREAEAGERGAGERHLGTNGQPDQRLADGFDGRADKRDLRSPNLVGQMAEEHPRENEGDRIGGVRGPSVGPPPRREQQCDERGHGAEAHGAECRAQTGHPHSADHFDERGACVPRRSNRGEKSDERQSTERSQRGRERDRREAISCIQSGAGGRADREGRKHGRPHPSDDLSGVLGMGERQTPAHRGRDDEAFRPGNPPS